MDCRPENPLLTLPTDQNLIAVEVDALPVTALIDTGAHISVMSADLRKRLKKVLTPAESRFVRVADGGTAAVLGMCAARVSVAGRHTSVLFHVLDHCPHDVILGLDFLSAHSAIIDCSAGVVKLDFPDATDLTDTVPIQLCCADFVRLSPQALTCITAVPNPCVPDGDYVVAPCVSALLSHGVSFPHTVVTVSANQTYLPLLNFGFCPQVLPKGISLATMSPSHEYALSSLSPLPSSSNSSAACNAHSATSPPAHAITKMIAPDLTPTQTDDLRHLLTSYSDILTLAVGHWDKPP